MEEMEMMNNNETAVVDELNPGEGEGLGLADVDSDGITTIITGGVGIGLGAGIGSKLTARKKDKEFQAALERVKQVVDEDEYDIILAAINEKPEKKKHWWQKIKVQSPISFGEDEKVETNKKDKESSKK